MSPAPRRKPVPLYEQVKQDILARITQGEWTSGARLPSEHQFMEQFQASRMTVHRALRELSAKGVLDRFQGIGTFVAAPPQRSELVSVRDIADEIKARGHVHRAEIFTLDTIRANIDLAATFELNVGARIFHSVIVHHEDDVAVQLDERFINPTFAPKYLEQDFTTVTPARYLQDVKPPTDIEQIIYAGLADERAQKLLDVGSMEPCLLVMRRTWVSGMPATKTYFRYPASRYSLGSRYKPFDQL